MTGAGDITAADVARLERWAARQAFVEHVRRLQARHPAWGPVEIIIELERQRALVLLDHPPGQYLVNLGTARRRIYNRIEDLSMPEPEL